MAIVTRVLAGFTPEEGCIICHDTCRRWTSVRASSPVKLENVISRGWEAFGAMSRRALALGTRAGTSLAIKIAVRVDRREKTTVASRLADSVGGVAGRVVMRADRTKGGISRAFLTGQVARVEQNLAFGKLEKVPFDHPDVGESDHFVGARKRIGLEKRLVKY